MRKCEVYNNGVFAGILAEECGSLMVDFFKDKRG